MQRTDLTPGEEARAYARLHDEFGLSDEAIGQRVKKSRSAVTSIRNLTRLPAAVLDRVGEGEGKLPLRYARTLIPVANALKPAEMLKAIDEITAAPPDDPANAPDPLDVITDLVHGVAVDLDTGYWDLAWPATPIAAHDKQGDLTIPSCRGCANFLDTVRRCADKRCHAAKVAAWTTFELERVSKKLKIAVASPTEKVTAIELDYRNEDLVKAHLKSKAGHLRLVPLGTQKESWRIKQLVGSPVVLLASMNLNELKAGPAPKPTPSPTADQADAETPAQKAKRLAEEEALKAQRRDERSAVRRARADVAWLGTHTAEIVAPQITASGTALEFLAWFALDEARSKGQWPQIHAAIDERTNALAEMTSPGLGKGKYREKLLKEVIVLQLLYHVIPDYSNDWELDWGEIVDRIKEVITETPEEGEWERLGLKLPAGWDRPPIHHTATNCWHCGKFTPGNEMTGVDRAAGWSTVSVGSGNDGMTLKDVSCPDCAKETRDKVQAEYKNSIGKSKPAPKPGKPVAKKPTTKK